MASAQHAKIIQQALEEKHISDISAVLAEVQMEVYTLALSKLSERAARHIPKEIPYETLVDSEEALNELSIVFSVLSMKPIGQQYKLEEDVLPKIEQALASVGRALSLSSKGKKGSEKEDLPPEYHECVIRFRRLLIQMCEYLREEP